MNKEQSESEYGFIIDNMTFSYSSLTTFENCPYCFKLSYIDRKNRINNFFAEYGLLIHDCMEQFFTKNLEAYELTQYFLDNYYGFIMDGPPPYPSGMEDNYKRQGIEFFDTFSFEIGKYDIVSIEDTVYFDIDGVNFTGRPDLILREKDTKDNILFDYKSSIVYRENKYTGEETTDFKKLEGYHKQMHLYSYGIRKYLQIPIDKISIWYTRPSRIETIAWTQDKEDETIAWVKSVIKRIKKENSFPYNNSSSFFCNNLCGVREDCEFRP